MFNDGKRNLKRWLLGAAGGYLMYIVVVGVVVGSIAVTVGIIGKAINDIWHGITDVISLPGNLISDLTGAGNSSLNHTVRASLDCNNVSPAQRAAGECINGLLDNGEGVSPIPADKDWMVPIWQAAGQQYNVPWELLAAVNATRTNYGAVDCQTNYGNGYYRESVQLWRKYATHSGQAKDTRPDSRNCSSSDQPATILTAQQAAKEHGSANWFDAVDSTFTEAKTLHALGVNTSTWNYSGSDSGGCTASPGDGTVYYLPDFSSGQTVTLPNGPLNKQIVQFFVSKGLTGAQASGIAGNWMVEAPTGPGEAQGGGATVPSTSSGLGYGLAQWGGSRLAALEALAQQTHQQISSAALQLVFTWDELTGTVPGDPGDSYTSILAQVKASTSPAQAAIIFSGSTNAGYPPGFESPGTPNMPARVAYANQIYAQYGGSVKGGVVSTSTNKPSKPQPYHGKAQTDAVSLAVRQYAPGENDTPCYVAVAHDWYNAIVAAPPNGVGLGGGQMTPGTTAHILPDGQATIPQQAPAPVQNALRAGNEITHTFYSQERRANMLTQVQDSYDCSGSTEFVLYNAGLRQPGVVEVGVDPYSGTLEGYEDPGPGKWITVYANAGHAWMSVAGLVFDTVHMVAVTPASVPDPPPNDPYFGSDPTNGGPTSGPRWQPGSTAATQIAWDSSGFVQRHPHGF